MSRDVKGTIHYDITLDSGEIATLHVPLPETDLDEWLVRHGIRCAEELIDRLAAEVPAKTEG